MSCARLTIYHRFLCRSAQHHPGNKLSKNKGYPPLISPRVIPFATTWRRGLGDLPLRATFSPAHPGMRRDASLAQVSTALDVILRSILRARGASKGDRPGHASLPHPSYPRNLLPPLSARRLAESQLRASNEALLRARVPRAQRLASHLSAFLPSRITPFVII